MINTFIHSRSSLKNQTRFQNKIGKVYTRFQTKMPQKPYPLRRHVGCTHLYSLFKKVPPPPPTPPQDPGSLSQKKGEYWEGARRKRQSNWGIENETGRLPLTPPPQSFADNVLGHFLAPTPTPFPVPRRGAWSPAKHKRHNSDAFRVQ